MTAKTRIGTALAGLLIAGSVFVPSALAGGGAGGIAVGGASPDKGSSASGKATFPIRARHSYGDGLGAGRNHQGQDIMAKCGRDVVAATGGRVRVVDYQGSGAGNYVVVKDRKSGFDYVYMHMLKKLRVSRGDRVSAGDLIGRVGSTGRSSACHLHFEMWRAPGWYRGGKLVNPTPFLKRWDRRR